MDAPYDNLELYSDFKNKGYMLLENAYKNNVLSDMKKKIDEISTKYPEYCKYDKSVISDDMILQKLYSPMYLDREFRDLVDINRIKSVVEHIWLEKAVLLTDKVNFKLPGGKGFYAHQDMQGLFKNYVDNIITAFICLDDSNEQNGCLEIAFYEKDIIKEHEKNALPNDLRIVKFKKIIQRAGDVILFDGHTVHQSGPNYSSAPRICLVLTFNKEKLGDFRELFIR